MLTAEEKAISWLSDNMPGFDERFNGDYVKSLTALLKWQDTDTRYACAKAVNEVESSPYHTDTCWIHHAHNACMNVKAV